MTRITIIAAAALLIGLGACSVPSSTGGANQTARNDHTPGWTGRTLVIGTSSTIAGAAAATYNEQKWQLQRGH